MHVFEIRSCIRAEEINLIFDEFQSLSRQTAFRVFLLDWNGLNFVFPWFLAGNSQSTVTLVEFILLIRVEVVVFLGFLRCLRLSSLVLVAHAAWFTL